jgi:hypothetical protein
MARRSTNPIQRFLNEYAALDTNGRGQIAAAIQGFESASGTGVVGGVKRASSVTPRKATTGVVGNSGAPASPATV